ncbi:MAG: hypothetical protein A2044_05990 [Candidatus Firestonebacteria bacterium GWA2_43_8]|nr:MAG: hypothetical protein A2044_05990 [Candidatus Firestonebacteria bacterium GWA2_43_8]
MNNKLIFALATAVCLSFLIGCGDNSIKPFNHEEELKKLPKDVQDIQKYLNSRSKFSEYTNVLINKSGYKIDEYHDYAKKNAFKRLDSSNLNDFKFDENVKKEVNVYGANYKAMQVFKIPLSSLNITAVWYSTDPSSRIWWDGAMMRMVLDDGKTKKDLIINERSSEKLTYDITQDFRLYKWTGKYKYVFLRRGDGVSSGTYTIFGIDKVGNIFYLLQVGGWQSRIEFIDLDNDSLPEVVYSVRSLPTEVRNNIPKDVVENDAKYPIPTPLTYIKTVNVFKMKDDKFENVGEYYVY